MTVPPSRQPDHRTADSPGSSLGRLFVLLATLAVLIAAPAAAGSASPVSVMATRTVHHGFAQESTTTTTPGGGDETTTTVPEEPEEEGKEGEAADSSREATWWRWILLVVLVAGAVAVITRSWGGAAPSPSQPIDAESALRRYGRVAAALRTGGGSPEEITYELGVLDGLSPLFGAIILHTTDKEEKAMLLSVGEAATELENYLQAAEADPNVGRSGALRSSAATLAERVDRAMAAL